MDRDGFQGWSRRSEAAHERIFGRRKPPVKLRCPDCFPCTGACRP